MLTPDECHIPPKSELDEADGLASNREYLDLRGASWDDVRGYLTLEDDLIPLLRSDGNEEIIKNRFLYETVFLEEGRAEDAEFSDDAIADFLWDHQWENEYDYLRVLDVGVASAVCALSAAKCVPAYSCNGGVYGSRHHADHPTIAFYARASRCDLLNAAAEKADVLLGACGEEAVLEADDVDAFRRFARAMLELHTKIPATKAIKGPTFQVPNVEQLAFAFSD